LKCPRIYTEFQAIDGKTEPFEFISPYMPADSHCRLLFKAKASTGDRSEDEVLVKVVKRAYGVQAHRLAAENGFAPKLYGVAEVDGAPPAYVMEFLSEQKGWVPPRNRYFKSPQQWDKLEAEINKFLAFLRKNNLVHGDLRRNNMLVHVQNDDVKLRVLDWDWAGAFGTARYPLNRNPQTNLPGKPGGLIDFDHDRSTLTETFQKAKASLLL
jgi:hypothetical protein